MSFLQAFLFGWAGVALAMLAFWVLQLSRTNAGVVDVVWAYSTALVAWWLIHSASDGDPWRHALLALMIGVWGVRLGTHLLIRLRDGIEDGRYVYFRKMLGDKLHPGMFAFFQVQALWVMIFVLPIWAASQSTRGTLDGLDVAGIIVWLIAISGETIADRQLASFKAVEANRGKVCERGLWRYSRHPNYFFEWIHWLAYPLIGWGSWWWLTTLAGVIVMYVFLTRLTGIPFTEKQSLRTRGEAYEAYQRTISVFFPMPPQS